MFTIKTLIVFVLFHLSVGVRGFCDEPDIPANSYITKKSHNGNNNRYDEGSYIDYNCEDDYIMNGNIRTTCKNGKWTKVDFQCTATFCEVLTSIPNGYVSQDADKDGRNYMNSKAVYTCKKGYRIFGTQETYTRHCVKDFKWNGTEPLCQVPHESCSDLSLENGKIKTSDASLGEYTIGCDQGYHLHVRTDEPCTCNNQKITCAAGMTFFCREDDCTIPSQFDSRLTLSQNKDGIQRYIGGDNVIKAGDDVIFNCSKVTDLIDEPFERLFKCRFGKWIAVDKNSWSFGTHGTFPECRKAECDPPCENDGKCHIDNKCVCGESYTGNRCEQAKCPEACEKNGGRCDYPGDCQCPVGSHGKNCEISGCQLPTEAAAYKGTKRVFRVHESIYAESMTCPQNYELSDSRMTCLESGSWDNIITCLRVRGFCDEPDVPAHSFIKEIIQAGNNSRYDEGSYVVYRCEDGYILEGNIRRICQQNGKWTNVNFQCIVKCPEACDKNGGRCDNPGVCVCLVGSYGKNCEISSCKLPTEAAAHKDNRRVFSVHESIIAESMTCPQNYEPSDRVMTCLENGTWDNIIIYLRSNFKYIISIQLSTQRHSSTKDDVYIELVGTNGKRTNKIEMYTWGTKGLSEINYSGKDVTPIDHVVISKKTKFAVDDNVLIAYVSIYVPEHDDYYVFKDQHPGKNWLTSDTPRTFTISTHPERCVHTYKQALYRTPVYRPHTIWTSVRGCKQACVKEESFRCASVYFMTSRENKNKGYCTLHRDSASSNHFRDSTQGETQREYRSYNRICRNK